MDKLESTKFLILMEVAFAIFLVVFVSFSAVTMAVAWEVLKTIQLGGTIFMAIYIISGLIVFLSIIFFIVRRLDEWLKTR